MRRLLIAVSALGLVAAACSSDGGGGSLDAFCDQLLALEERDAEGSELSDEEAVEVFQQLRDDAPEDIRDDVDTVLELIEQLAGLGEDDPEAIDEAFPAIFDPDVTAALGRFTDFAVDECGVDPAVFGLEGLEDLEGLEEPPVSDDEGASPDGDGPSTDGFDAYAQENFPDSPWLGSIGGTALGTFDGQADFSLNVGDTVTSDDAVEVCEAAEEYLASEGVTEITITVSTGDTELAAKAPDGVCEAV